MKYAPPEIKKIPGVRFVHDRPGGAWQARIKQDGTEKTISFGVHKHGNEEACRQAVQAREAFNEQYGCQNCGHQHGQQQRGEDRSSHIADGRGKGRRGD